LCVRAPRVSGSSEPECLGCAPPLPQHQALPVCGGGVNVLCTRWCQWADADPPATSSVRCEKGRERVTFLTSAQVLYAMPLITHTLAFGRCCPREFNFFTFRSHVLLLLLRLGVCRCRLLLVFRRIATRVILSFQARVTSSTAPLLPASRAPPPPDRFNSVLVCPGLLVYLDVA